MLRKFTCLEWTVPLSGGKSGKFLFQNLECFFKFNYSHRTATESYPALTIESESNIPLFFKVRVQIITDYDTATYPVKSVQGNAPCEIWRCVAHEEPNLATDDIMSFRVHFAGGIELIEDANPKTDNDQVGLPSSLKKVTCLEWEIEPSELCPLPTELCPLPYEQNPVTAKSSTFLMDNGHRYFFTINSRQLPRELLSMHTLSFHIDSEARLPLLFEVTIQVGRGYGEVSYPTETVRDCSLPHVIWKSEPIYRVGIENPILYFRVIFSNYINKEILENADGRTCSEESTSTTSEQFTQTPHTDCEISLRSLSSDLRKLLLSDDSKSDVSILCGDCTIPAHRNILATRSAVLKAMLQTNEAESDARILRIVDMEASVCRKFVEYLYTASLPDLSVELALGLYEAGKKYGVDSLKRQCSDFLKQNLSVEDAISDIIDNDEILSSSQWARFCESQPNLAIQALQHAYKKAKNPK